MVRVLGHRQTKGAATDKPNLTPPRHISTLPVAGSRSDKVEQRTENPRVGGSIPPLATIFSRCIPVTWFTPCSGHMVNTLSGTIGEGPGSTRSLSLSKYHSSYSRKLTSQIWLSTCLMLTIWPANTVLRLILRLPKQMRPQRVTPGGFPVAYQHAFNTANRVDGATPIMPTPLLAAAPMTPATAMPNVTVTNKKQ